MFHWTPARPIEECIIVSTLHRNINCAPKNENNFGAIALNLLCFVSGATF